MAQQADADTSAPVLLLRAYEKLNSSPAEATPLFERAVVLDPSNILARRQLGYLYLSQQKNALSLEQFQASEQIHSSDSIKLQIAYLLISLGRVEEGRKAFAGLKSSVYPDIAEKASDELDAASPDNLSASRFWTRIYADPYFDTRWNSTFINVNFQDGYYFADDQKVGGYGVIALSTDTRSSGAGVPVIISDNSLLVGAGIRVNPFPGFSAIVQEGAVFDLIQSGSSGDVKNDFRIVATYANGIYAPFNLHRDVKLPFASFVDGYSSLGYYSRYKNVIGSFQLKGGLRALEVSRTVVDVYALGNIVRDSEQEFYNNILEGGIGIQCTPNMNWGLHVLGEYRRGNYLNVSDKTRQARSGLYNQSYDSFRLMVILEHFFH
jgi:hypothetical protein